jgi:CRP-like cAMP-binding protein
MIKIMSKKSIPLPGLEHEPQFAALGSGLLSTVQAVHAPAGTPLFRSGEKPSKIFYVREGEALMQRMTSSGTAVVLQRATKSFLAEASLTSARYHCDGVCRTDCELLAFPVRAIRDAIDHNAETRWAWIGMLATQSRQQRTRIERLMLKTVRERLHHLILTEGSPEGAYTLPGTRMELAAELGVTHEALYRSLAALQSEHVLAFEEATMKWRA